MAINSMAKKNFTIARVITDEEEAEVLASTKEEALTLAEENPEDYMWQNTSAFSSEITYRIAEVIS